jgi:hypothetical protein
MRRVLILGLYYPPANFSASRRLEGWARHLPSFGYEPLVLTRYYDPAERNSGDFYASSRPTRTLQEPWIESNHVVYTRFVQSKWSTLPLPGKFRGLGHFVWPDPDHSGWLRQCSAYLENASFQPDLIIASCSPPGVFRVARKLSERLGVPWIADFRDLWLQYLNDDFPSRVKLFLQRRHLQSAAGITVVTDGMVESAQKQLDPLKKPIRAIYNGADPTGQVAPDEKDGEAVAEFEGIQSRYSMVLTYPGTLYPEQHIERHLDAIANFNESGRGTCAVVLVGGHDPVAYKQWPFVKVLGRVSHQTSLFLQSKSSALFYPTWPATDSVYSGKIFELLVSGLPVLVGFTPSPDLESLCRNFQTVSVIKSPKELLDRLSQLPGTSVDPAIAVNEIATKRYWAGELARFFDEILATKQKTN